MTHEAENARTCVPVFPLPDVTLFPHSLLPLHVFEARYVAMASDALDGDRRIAMAMLRPGYEPVYFTNEAPIHEVVGVGRIVAAQRYDDGRYDLLLRGECRARITREVGGMPYRRAEFEPIASTHITTDECGESWREQMRNIFAAGAGLAEGQLGELAEILRLDAPLAKLTDLAAAALPLQSEQRQDLLEQPCPSLRGRLLLKWAAELAARARCQGSRRWQSPAQRN